MSTDEIINNTKIKSIKYEKLRWVAVPFAAVGAYIGIASLNILFTSESIFFVRLSISAVAPAAFVVAGAITAPKKQFLVGIVLAVIQTLYVVLGLFLNLIYENVYPFWHYAIFGIVSIITTILACIGLYEEKKDEQLK